jgi:hypothetical protein
MSMMEPKCYTRKCKHLTGIINTDPFVTDSGYYACKAFPDGKGIPQEIVLGDEKHLSPLPGQGNDIIYEREASA